ncbi:MAG: undecaprenyl-diphosphate phosphatase [Chlamydiales bacterium]|nr:undecaprenyl-diphosphate phosphatase [Chlamydiales bacterium]
MSLIEALILGLVQGFTEFLPISSSSHLQITKWLLNLPAEGSTYFDLVCHTGTICSTMIYLQTSILNLFKDPRRLAVFSLALIPLLPVYFLTRELRANLDHLSYIGFGLLTSSALLGLSYLLRTQIRDIKDIKWQDMLWIGFMQTLAFIPGISRSGSTIAAARLRGWSWIEAARFSFLLSIPTILGGQCLETIKLFQQKDAIALLPWNCYFIGFMSAFCFGLLSIHLVFQIYQSARAIPLLACYCAAIGLLALSLFHA